MMKKFLSLLGVSLLGISVIQAVPLTPEEALARVNGSTSRLNVARSSSSELILTLKDEQNQAAVYVFENAGANKGFKIVSADNATVPLLGYTDSGAFDAQNIPPALNYWLETFVEQIDWLRQQGLTSSENLVATYSNNYSWSAISPLVTTKWNQDSPYNDKCILELTSGGTIKCVTGCVATAMAQVMNYHNFPATGQGTITYKPYSNVNELSMDFSQTNFDWENMLNSYSGNYTNAQANAVATLMKACGYSVEMKYGQNDSGASSTKIAGALINYFKYSPSTHLEMRNYYSSDEWTSMVYDNLQNIGPLIYNGSTLTGGHSFICDGYDGNGYFHFNWGWGGMSDGYFLLNDLNPSSQGIGGYAGGYTLNQDAIFGITPSIGSNESLPVQLIQYGSLLGSVSNSTLSLTTDQNNGSWGYMGYGSVTVDLGVILQNELNAENQCLASNKKGLGLTTGQYYYNITCNVDLSSANLIDGEQYKVIMASHSTTGPENDWVPVLVEPGMYNYLYITKNGNTYTVVNENHVDLVATALSVNPNPVYFGLPVKFNATFKNDGNSELTRNINVVLLDSSGVQRYATENIFITVDANSTLEKEWTSTGWYTVNSASAPAHAETFTLKLYDNDNNQIIESPEVRLTLEPDAVEPVYTATLSLENAEIDQDLTSQDYTYYRIKGTKTFTSVLNVEVTEGYFSKELQVILLAPEASGYTYKQVMSQSFPTVPMLTGPASEILKTSVTFQDAEYNVAYMCKVYSSRTAISNTLMLIFEDEESEPVIPELPQYTVSLAPDTEIEASEFESISLNWGANNLELINPGLVKVKNNETTIENPIVTLTSNTIESVVYEEGMLNILLPENINLEEGSLQITIPAGVVNVIIDNVKIANTAITLNYNIKIGSVPVVKVTSISITPEEPEALQVGETTTFTAKVIPENANDRTVLWTLSKDGIVALTVSEENPNEVSIEALSAGEDILTATAADGSEVSAEVKIIVLDSESTVIPATAVEISGYADDTIYVGTIVQLIATVYPEDCTYPEVVWSSSNEDIASVSETGVVTALSEGKVEITVTMVAYPEVSASWNVNVIEENVSGLSHISTDDNGYYHIYTMTGALLKITTDIKEIKNLDKGVYVINRQKVVIR